MILNSPPMAHVKPPPMRERNASPAVPENDVRVESKSYPLASGRTKQFADDRWVAEIPAQPPRTKLPCPIAAISFWSLPKR